MKKTTIQTVKINPVGLRALTKIIVYGNNAKERFTQAEMLFVDAEEALQKQSSKVLNLSSQKGKSVSITSNVLKSLFAYKTIFKKRTI